MSQTDHTPLQAEALLSLQGVSKTFDGVRAIDDLSLDLRGAEICGLVGPNGCGKSTLIKILAGIYRADSGSEVREVAEEVPMAFVHQDLGLVSSATVLENMAIGTGYHTRFGLLRDRKQVAATEAMLEGFGSEAKPLDMVASLSPADCALVAIARAFAVLQAGREGAETAAGLLVLDEPTASLHSEGSEKVLAAAREVSSRGSGVLFVSHRLDEVLATCNRVAVMRDGRLVADRGTADLDSDRLVELMLGRELTPTTAAAPAARSSRPLLVAHELRGPRLEGVSISVEPGEVVGVTGLLGSGKSELARMLAGAQTPESGYVERTAADGGEGERWSGPRGALAAGLAYVPQDRRGAGSILSFTATENLTLPDLRNFTGPTGVRQRLERRTAAEWMSKFDVVPRAPGKIFGTFSGGNQQKLLLAKWMRMEPSVVILDEPTQAVDVGAVQQILSLVGEYASRGVGIVICSSEPEELATVCHRVCLLERGRLIGEVSGAGMSGDAIEAALLGAGLKLTANTNRERSDSDE